MNTIREQWNALPLTDNIYMVAIPLVDEGQLTVEIQLTEDDNELVFSFPKEPLYDTTFSDDVIHVIGDVYQLNTNYCCIDLNIYLQQIQQEVLEGYVVPNGLYSD